MFKNQQKIKDPQMIRLFRTAVFFLLILSSAAFSTSANNAQYLALVGATVYSSPTAAALHDAVVLISGGAITDVGKRTEIKIPKDARVIDCTGKTIVAGFWNSHIHLTEPAWNNAGSAPADRPRKAHAGNADALGLHHRLGSGLRSQQFSRSPPPRRIGRNPGPKILLAGDIFPKNGHPVYLPAEMQLPEAATPDEAVQMARNDLKMGLDGMKLFTGAYMGDKPVINMDAAIVKAAVDVAHAQGKPVFAHPQNRIGVDNAIAGGVDILAHTVPTETQLHGRGTGSFQIPTHCPDPHPHFGRLLSATPP